MTVTSAMITASTPICLEIVLSINLPRRDEPTRGDLSLLTQLFFQNPRRDFNRFRERFEKGLIKSGLKNWVIARKFYRRAQPQFVFGPVSVLNPRMQSSVSQAGLAADS